MYLHWKKYKKTHGLMLAKFGLVVLLFVVGIHFSSGQGQLLSLGNSSAIAQQQAEGVIRPANISGVVKQTSPAVVKIETIIQSNVTANPYLNDPFFRQFFESRGMTNTQIQKGMGSGFIVSEDGYIITNNHVIEGATEIKVILTTNKSYQAKVIGSDKELDLAVLKISPDEKLKTLKLGNSDQAEVGDWVIAIGNPYGLDHTVTVGVISAKGRPVAIEDKNFRNLLQTDASINPGNSGGPLINLQGEVVGVNTAINSQAQGIGFAIPSTTVASVYNQLITKGTVAHPYLGVNIQPTQDQRGVMVSGIIQNSPANAAGIRVGDVIVKFNGKNIETTQGLLDAVADSQVGEKVTLEVISSGQMKEIKIIMGDKSNIK